MTGKEGKIRRERGGAAQRSENRGQECEKGKYTKSDKNRREKYKKRNS